MSLLIDIITIDINRLPLLERTPDRVREELLKYPNQKLHPYDVENIVECVMCKLLNGNIPHLAKKVW